jgi:very-short-patch-repair endonuclease
LYAAEHGKRKDAAMPGKDHDSDFEAAVCRALRDRGWEVHSQVGCAGFAIDLAVVDPRATGRYLLGIECDGATYHSSPTARDRDRLRQAVLEGLGWQIQRVWSRDWFERPNAVLDGLLKRLEQLKEQPLEETAPTLAIREGQAPTVSIVSGESTVEADASHVAHTTELPSGVAPYSHRRDAAPLGTSESLAQMPASKLVEIVRDIVQIEGPIHDEEATRVLAEMFQSRVSPRLRETFERAAARAVESGWVAQRGAFLWPSGLRNVQIRHRNDGCPVTRPELIPPEEFEEAIRLVLRQQFGLKFDAVSESVCRLFGFARAGAKLKAAVEAAMIRLDKQGEIEVDGSQYVTLKEIASERTKSPQLNADGHR